jgi:hypothetical protein
VSGISEPLQNCRQEELSVTSTAKSHIELARAGQVPQPLILVEKVAIGCPLCCVVEVELSETASLALSVRGLNGDLDGSA